MKKRKAYFIDCDYVVRKGKTYVRLLLKGKRVTRLYYRYDPYFLVAAPPEKKEDLMKVTTLKHGREEVKPLKVEETTRQVGQEKKTFLKVFAREPSHVPLLKSAMPYPCYEAAIPFGRRFIFDMALAPFSLLHYEREGGLIKKITGTEPGMPEIKALSFDIETYNPLGMPRKEDDPILMVSYACGERKGVITWKPVETAENVELVKDEREMLKRFGKIIEELDPDVMAGYNSANFDLPYLRARSEVEKADLNMGRWTARLKEVKKGLITGMELDGRIHVDLYPLARFFGAIGVIKASRFTLDAIAREVLGKKKMPVDRDTIWKIWDSGKIDGLAEYALIDAEITDELAGRFLPLEMELSSMTRVPLFDTALSTSGQLVENLLMCVAAEKGNLIPPKPRDNTVSERLADPIKGGFVKLPEPGIYDNIAVLDFRGLYPSIIVSYNIDPGTLTEETEGAHESPSGAHFLKKPMGLVPSVLDWLVDYRVKIKRELKTLDKDGKEFTILSARSHAIKILTNSFYGYLGYARSRWYSRDCAESVTAWGREHIMQTIERAENMGFRVLYADSLPYDRYIFIQNEKGMIKLTKIGEFVDKNRNNKSLSNYKTLAYEAGDYDSGKVVFKPIRRAIRHAYSSLEKGNLLEITTKHGRTTVTPQHSVYYYNKGIKLTDARKLKKGDKLISLTNPRMKVVYREGHTFDLFSLDYGPYNKELRAYPDTLRFPAKRGICPYCGKECFLSTHVNTRHINRKLKLPKATKSDYAWLGSKNPKGGRTRRYWKLNKELAWILGYYCAEGSISEHHGKYGRKLMLSFGSQDKKQIERVLAFFNKRYESKAAIIKDYDKRTKKHMYYGRVQSIAMVALFKYGFMTGKGSENKRVPKFIFTSEERIKESFLKGYLEGDGNTKKDKRYRTHFHKFSTNSKELAIGLCFLFKSIKHKENWFGNRIEHISWTYRKDKPLVNSLRLQAIKTGEREHGNYCVSEIKSIREIEEKGFVYDLEVEDCHNFVDAEGLILVHNTDSTFLLMDEKGKKNVMQFMDEVNASLPEKMELELEGFYTRGVFVGKKGKEARGAKKKYALLGEDGRMKIRGFELVRRDWSPIAKDTQRRVLDAILREGSKEKAAAIVKETVSRLNSGKVPLEELAISTQLKKKPEEYEVVSPELAAAKKAMEKGRHMEKGSIISYVVTGCGGKTVSEKAELLEFAKDYDAGYYINNQVLPSVMKILKELGYDEYGLKVGGKQKSLESFL